MKKLKKLPHQQREKSKLLTMAEIDSGLSWKLGSTIHENRNQYFRIKPEKEAKP